MHINLFQTQAFDWSSTVYMDFNHVNLKLFDTPWHRYPRQIVYTAVYSGEDQRKHQSSASLGFLREIHRGPVNFPHK